MINEDILLQLITAFIVAWNAYQVNRANKKIEEVKKTVVLVAQATTNGAPKT